MKCTVKELTKTMNKYQKNLLYFLVGWSLHHASLPLVIRQYRNGGNPVDGSISDSWYPLFETFTDEQKRAIDLLCEKANNAYEVNLGEMYVKSISNYTIID